VIFKFLHLTLGQNKVKPEDDAYQYEVYFWTEVFTLIQSDVEISIQVTQLFETLKFSILSEMASRFNREETEVLDVGAYRQGVFSAFFGVGIGENER